MGLVQGDAQPLVARNEGSELRRASTEGEQSGREQADLVATRRFRGWRLATRGGSTLMRKPAAFASAMFVAALCLVTSPSASAGDTQGCSFDRPPLIDSHVTDENVGNFAVTALAATTCTGAVGANSRARTGSPPARAIVFTRFLPGADTGSVYRIDAGTTVEHLIRSGVLDFALLSPDATQFADFAFTSGGEVTTAIF